MKHSSANAFTLNSPKFSRLRIRILLVFVALMISYAGYWLWLEKFETWNSQIIDHLLMLKANVNPPDQIEENIIAHVDANFYVNRSDHARVINNLSAMNVSALMIDYIFADRVGEEDDRSLIDATRKAGRVYFGLTFDSLSRQYSEYHEVLNPEASRYLDQSKWQLSAKAGSDIFYAGVNPKITFAELAFASQGLGFLNIAADQDGILRRIPLLVSFRGAYYPSLALRVVCDYLNVSPQDIMVEPGESIILKQARKRNASTGYDIVIPIDDRGNLLINYSLPYESARHYSYREILQAAQEAAKLVELKNELAGKIVILSEAVEEGFVIRPNKAGMKLSSGQIQSIVLQNVLAQSFLRKVSGTSMFFLESAMLIVLLYLSVRFSSTPLTLTAMGATVIFCLLGIFSLIYFNTIFQFVRPLLSMILALSFLLIYIGIESALVYAEVERARKIAERELEIGRQIQAGFFPTALPMPEGWELITHFQAARHVAGDFYDVFTLGKEKKIGIVIADVCDKGVGAALFMALFRSLVRVLSGQAGSNNHLEIKQSVNDPQKTLENSIQSINNYISVTHEDAGMFATMFYGILDPETGKLHYINGGHEPPAILNNAGDTAWLSPTGPAVGLYPHLNFEVGHITLEPDETLVLFTDGVTDAQNKSGESFGKKRLTAILTQKYPSAKKLVHTILDQINSHIADQGQFDDITIVALRRTASMQEVPTKS